jgi:protein TonB
MGNNSNYFYISGFISISLFLFFLFSFFIMMFQTSKIDSYALSKDNFISVSIELPTVVQSKPKENIKSATVQEETKEVSKNIDVNDLFSDVWTKKIVPKKEKEVNSKRIQEIQKKIKTVESNDVESLTEKVNNLDNVTSNEQENSSSTANEVNEYLAKIQALVYQYFNVPANTEGNSIKSVIELDALGKVIDFRILNYSANLALNEEADKIKERLRNVIFPVNPQNRSSRTIVILISKE